jgi:acetylornithine deacetylase/succinyl-diaminopimelate desuccinylase-like protein
VAELAAALAALRANEAADRERLAAFVSIPSVSSDPAHAADVRRGVEFLAGELRRLGFADVTVHGTPLHPAVTARHLGAGPGAPTVLVYGHADVQPVDPVGEWVSPPYEVAERDGCLWGRGVTDDKGQVLMHLRSFEAWLAAAGRLPVNVLFLADGEEEIGSPSLPRLLLDNPWLGDAGVLVVSDSPMLARNVPAVGYSLRGLTYAEVGLTALAGDLHSGQFGGAVRNPAQALAEMVAALHDADGRVAVPGFYDQVVDLDADERDFLATIPFDERAWLDAIGAGGGVGEAGYSALERTWGRPTLEVNGLASGYAGSGPKTIVPARASAKLSMRLVPDQDPSAVGELVVEHLRRIAPSFVDVEASWSISSRPVVTDRRHPAVALAREALAEAFGAPAWLIRDGGTIPAAAMVQAQLGIPAVLLGFGCPDENKHAPNEWLALEHFRRGPEALVRLWARLAGS